MPATSITGSYQVSWASAASPTGVTYVLEESVNEGSFTEIYQGTLRYQNLTGRQDGSYRYRVKAFISGYVDSSWQNSVICAVVLTCATPATITVPASSITGSYQVNWSSAASPTGVTYVLEESVNEGSFSEIYRGTQPSFFPEHSNGSYQYRVKAIKTGYADSGWRSSAACAVTLTCATPTSITVPASSITGSYQVSWPSAASPTGVTYVLEESVNNGGFIEIYQGTLRSQNLTGRQDGSYRYRVKALKSGYVDSSWQNSVICAVVLTCPTPTSITVPATSITGSYKVSWASAVSPTGVTYVLEESVNDGGFSEIYRGTQANFSPEHSNGSYQYRVKAIKTGYADSERRTSAECAVLLTCATPTLITVPATSITGSYQVSWPSPASPTGVTYVLEESVNDGGFNEIYQGTLRSQSLTGRQDGSYQYRVKALKLGYVDSSWQNSVICAVVLTCATPASITVPATSITGSYQVSWASAASPTGVTYVLEESVNNSGFIEIYQGTLRSQSLTGRQDGNYQYRVKALKSGYVDSSWQNSVICAVVLTCATPTLITVPATSINGSYQVSWASAVSPTGVTYVLEESLNDGPWSMVQTGSQNYKSFSGKAAGSYLYRVKAVKSGYLDSDWKTSSACLVTQ